MIVSLCENGAVILFTFGLQVLEGGASHRYL